MRVLCLAASSNRAEHKGNSDTLLQHFIAGIRATAPTAVVHQVYLDDVPMEFYCYLTRDPLPSETAFQGLCQELSHADGLVIATPTWNWNVPAVLKNFIDRIGTLALDYSKKNALGQPPGRLQRLHVYTINTGGTPAWARRLLFFLYPLWYLRCVFLYYGAWRYRGHYYGGYTYSQPVAEDSKALQHAYRAGQRYAERVQSYREQ